jgi:inositol phosphorylceramide mannosyltransferase catalytic subunit
MYKYGGVYADLDVECLSDHTRLTSTLEYVHPISAMKTLELTESSLKKLTPSADRKFPELLLPIMETKDYSFEHNIPNAWMASRPGHPFWMHVINRIMSNDANHYYPEGATGPIVLYKTYKQYMTSYLASSKNEFPPVELVEPGQFCCYLHYKYIKV